MCKYFSCIIDRNGQVYWLKNSNSHEDIIHINNLKDDKIEDRDIVRIEIIPKDKKRVTRNKKDWVLNVDELETLPEWYVKNKKQNEKLCWNEWKKSVKEQIAINTEKRIVKDIYVETYGNSYVIAQDNSRVKAYCNSQVKANDNSHVEAHNDSYVMAYDNSCVEAYNRSYVKAHDDSEILLYNKAICHRHSGKVKLNSEMCVCIDMFANKVLLKEGAKVEFQKRD